MEPATNSQHRLYEQNTDLLKFTFLLTHSDSSLTLVSLFRRTMFFVTAGWNFGGGGLHLHVKLWNMKWTLAKTLSSLDSLLHCGFDIYNSACPRQWRNLFVCPHPICCCVIFSHIGINITVSGTAEYLSSLVMWRWHIIKAKNLIHKSNLKRSKHWKIFQQLLHRDYMVCVSLCKKKKKIQYELNNL